MRDRRIDRAITHYEAFVPQGFPEDFSRLTLRTEIARRIGAVVPAIPTRAVTHQVKQHPVSFGTSS